MLSLHDVIPHEVGSAHSDDDAPFDEEDSQGANEMGHSGQGLCAPDGIDGQTLQDAIDMLQGSGKDLLKQIQAFITENPVAVASGGLTIKMLKRTHTALSRGIALCCQQVMARQEELAKTKTIALNDCLRIVGTTIFKVFSFIHDWKHWGWA